MIIKNRTVHNFIVVIGSFLSAIISMAIMVSILLFAIGMTMTIAEQNGNSPLLIVTAIWGILSAMVGISTGAWFYGKFERVWY